jgi:hypothetical protein
VPRREERRHDCYCAESYGSGSISLRVEIKVHANGDHALVRLPRRDACFPHGAQLWWHEVPVTLSTRSSGRRRFGGQTQDCVKQGPTKADNGGRVTAPTGRTRPITPTSPSTAPPATTTAPRRTRPTGWMVKKGTGSNALGDSYRCGHTVHQGQSTQLWKAPVQGHLLEVHSIRVERTANPRKTEPR